MDKVSERDSFFRAVLGWVFMVDLLDFGWDFRGVFEVENYGLSYPIGFLSPFLCVEWRDGLSVKSCIYYGYASYVTGKLWQT